jgi:hypothetical protein
MKEILLGLGTFFMFGLLSERSAIVRFDLAHNMCGRADSLGAERRLAKEIAVNGTFFAVT